MHGSFLLFWRVTKILHRKTEKEVGAGGVRSQREERVGSDGRRQFSVGEQESGQAPENGAVLGQFYHIERMNQMRSIVHMCFPSSVILEKKLAGKNRTHFSNTTHDPILHTKYHYKFPTYFAFYAHAKFSKG